MEPGDVMALLITILLPTAFLLYLARRYFSYKEKKLDLEMSIAAEKAAQYAANNSELEARLRVLEQIVTDRGAETAAQIEALRRPRISRVASNSDDAAA
jgi:hypothetical protein